MTNAVPASVEQRAEQAGDEARAEVLGVGVQEDDDVAGGRREPAPHRVALAQRGAELRQQRALVGHPRAAAGGDRGGAVARRGVDHEQLVDEPEPLQRRDRVEHRADRARHLARGEHEADRRALALGQRGGVEVLGAVAARGQPAGAAQVDGEAARGAAARCAPRW